MSDIEPDGTLTGWCPDCRRRREVVDESDESAFEHPRSETTYWVTRFVCGHETATKTGEIPLNW